MNKKLFLCAMVILVFVLNIFPVNAFAQEGSRRAQAKRIKAEIHRHRTAIRDLVKQLKDLGRPGDAGEGGEDDYYGDEEYGDTGDDGKLPLTPEERAKRRERLEHRRERLRHEGAKEHRKDVLEHKAKEHRKDALEHKRRAEHKEKGKHLKGKAHGKKAGHAPAKRVGGGHKGGHRK